MTPLAQLLFRRGAFSAACAGGVVWLLAAAEVAAVNLPLRWRWANPAPHGGNVVDMAYSPTLLLGVQVAERGQIYTSDDLALWLPRDSGTTDALRAVAFFGPRIVITGENGRVLYADDPTDFRNGTLLDGATTDWLEAVAASPALVVAVGDRGAVYTSQNGISWKRQTSGVTSWLRGVEFGSYFGFPTFVAVGDAGTILTSNNGTNWLARTSGTTRNLNRVSFAGSRFTVVGDGGTTLTSTNGGAGWFAESPGATNTLHNAATGNGARLLVGTHEVRLQEGGVWGNELAKTNGPPDWTYYSIVGRPDFFLIAGQTGLQSEGYQTNTAPYFWLTPFNSVRNWLWDVTRAANLYVAVGDFGTVMTSGNGVDWTFEAVPPVVTNTTFLGVGGTTNLLVAVGDSGTVIVSPATLTNVVVTNLTGEVSTQTVSSVGVIWYAIPPPTTNDLQGVAALGTNLFVLTGLNGAILTSLNGTNWLPQNSGTSKLLTSVASWPGGLVAVGDDGTIVASPDGFSWTAQSSGTTNWLYRVRHLNGVLVIVGQNGTILTSTNGTAWTPRASGTTKWLNDVTFIEDTWFAIGVSGTVLSSSDLVTWTSRGTITKKALYGAATDSQQLIAVGVEGAILRSPVVPPLTPVSFLNYSRVATNGPAVAQNVFLFGGQTDQRFTLDYLANLDGTNWVTGPALEIFDGSGTLYYVETIFGTNPPPQEYYRATLLP